jgi:hypothetical protein
MLTLPPTSESVVARILARAWKVSVGSRVMMLIRPAEADLP